MSTHTSPDVRAAVLYDLVITATFRIQQAATPTLGALQAMLCDEDWSVQPHEQTLMRALLAYVKDEIQSRQRLLNLPF